ncbi:Auxin-responsive protein [Actinidia chinensis var. chinensis]|uniref:Auxin-responsive protein n=1 Tax=Actinidia chinensis var. chinensis TaxID=1590841 RepID=A0A2R6Q3Z6_ACTCC|nr:Auxin-responsive protein [Actinidia chinensis var. chinensis]
MLGKKMGSMKKLAKKVKIKGGSSQQESLLRESCNTHDQEGSSPPSSKTPTGFFALYVGEERERFLVPTGYLSHPLFKMLLDKAYNEFGFEQRNGLVVPCSVGAFQEVVSAVEGCQGKFDFGNLVQEFI